MKGPWLDVKYLSYVNYVDHVDHERNIDMVT